MGVDVLEYIVRLRGASVASAQTRALARDFEKVAVANKDVTAAEVEGAAASRRAAARRASTMALLTKTSRVGALAIAAIGFEAVKASNTFDTEMLKIQTDAGASAGELSFMRDEVLKLAESGKSMGASPTSLAQGLYHLESLGIRGKKALRALELASQASAISGASLEETTSAMGAAMYVGIKGAGGLDHIMATLNATVGTGNMRMGELVHALGTGVLPAAKLAGLSIQDVMAALAVFSDSGQNASSAAAQFATALHFITNPTTKAQDALATLHMTQDRLAQDMRKPNGMVTALRDLRDHLDKLPGGARGIQAGRVLGAIFPGGRGRVLQTELVMLDRAQQKWGQVNKLATPEHWKAGIVVQKDNPATQLATAWAKLEATMIRFGRKVGPVVLPVLLTLMSAAAGVLHVFAAFPQIPLVGFIALLTLSFLALFRGIGRAAGALTRYALAMPAAQAETVALTAETDGLAASEVAAGAAGRGMATTLMRWAPPVAAAYAFLEGSGLLHPDTAGLTPGQEGAQLKHYRSAHHDTAARMRRRQMRAYEGPHGSEMLEMDLEAGLEMGQAQRNTLNRYYRRHHIAAPKLLGPISDVPGTGRFHEIVLKVDGREIARATRKQIREAQARG